MNTIEIAAASVLGREHRRTDRPCQDAFAIRRGAGSVVAVVCDGCGSGAHSELGARLGAHAFARALGGRLDRGAAVDDRDAWRGACDDVVARLANLLPDLAIDGDLGAAIASHLLFTLLAVAITPVGSAVVAIGDGVIVVDGVARVLEAENDAPAYLGYELVGATTALALEPVTARAIVLATDGARPLLGELEQLHRDARVFAHKDALRRRLYLASRDPEAGLVDDATVVGIRGIPC